MEMIYSNELFIGKTVRQGGSMRTHRVSCGFFSLALAFFVPWTAKADSVYAFAAQQITNVTVVGGTVTQEGFATATSASLNGLGLAYNDIPTNQDTIQAYIGPVNTAPKENTFTAEGQVNPNYARGDVRLKGAAYIENVAESYLANGTTLLSGFGQGSWTESMLIAVPGGGPLTLSLNYSNILTLETNKAAKPLAEGSFSFAATIVGPHQTQVLSWSPVELNQTDSLILRDDVFSRVVIGLSVMDTTVPLAKGDYLLTLSGNETVNTELAPEPSSMALLAMGGTVLWLKSRRKRK